MTPVQAASRLVALMPKAMPPRMHSIWVRNAPEPAVVMIAIRHEWKQPVAIPDHIVGVPIVKTDWPEEAA